MVYGTTLRLPGEFFTDVDMLPDPQTFLERFRQHMQLIRSIPAAHYHKKTAFVHQDLFTCRANVQSMNSFYLWTSVPTPLKLSFRFFPVATTLCFVIFVLILRFVEPVGLRVQQKLKVGR